MHKYFVEWLPVKGEIKNGDFVAFEGNMNEILQMGKDLIPPPKYSDRKVKLFLCSRDVKAGDEVYIKSHFLYSYPVMLFENLEDVPVGIVGLLFNSSFVKERKVFKKIGEISKEATWIKRGDEFGEDDILRDVLIKDTFYDDFIHLYPKGDESIRELSETEKIVIEYPIKIKGPCGHFH